MPPSRMLVSVVQATILDIISFAGSKYLYQRAFNQIPPEGFGVSPNATIAGNSTQSEFNPKDFIDESPYGFQLAREIVVTIIVNVMLYYWFIWLERTFPTRSKAFAREAVHDKGDSDEQVEEEIIQKWIAQGKIKRASINWGNTFAKWGLHMSVGLFVQCAARVSIEKMANFRSFIRMDWKFWQIGTDAILNAILSWFSIYPLASLVGFIVVPAPKLVVFEEGVGCAWNIFIAVFVGVMLPWLHRQKIIWDAFAANVTSNGTEAMGKEL